MEQETTKIIRIVIDSSKAVDGSAAATRALANLEHQAESIGSTLSRVEKALGGVADMVKTNLLLQLEHLGERILESGKQAFEAAAHLENLAEQLGTTAQNLQALQYAAVQSGVSMDDLQTSVSKFSQKIGEAANGSKAQIDALDRLGVKILDANGHLRDNESVMQEVAKAILGIEDPAKRSAAAVEFFGRSGTKMLSTLQEVAKGSDAMAASANQGSALISDGTIKRLAAIDEAFERMKLKQRAGFAELLADAADYAEKADSFLQKQANAANSWLYSKGDNQGGGFADSIRTGMQEAAVIIARFNAEFVETFKSLPGLLGSAIIDGINAMLGGLGAGLSKINDLIADNLPWLGAKKGAVPVPQLPGGGASWGSYRAGVTAAGDKAAADLRTQQNQDYLARQDAAALARQASMQDDEAAARGGPKLSTASGPGRSNPTSTEAASAAQSLAERIKKEQDALTAAADAQDRMTAAARAGDVAFQEQEAHATALAKAIEIYGGKLDAADPKVQALAGSLEKLIARTKEGQAAQNFVVATTELEKQNDLLALQNSLMGAAPDVQAREIALMKSQQEAQKAGNALTAQDVENRRAAIEANENLKLQAEQLKQAQELWTEPLKGALRDIQSTAANAFESILQSGNFSFQSLAQTFTGVIRKMAAEFLALATVRPVMSMLVSSAVSIGAISPAMASQVGFPTASAAAASGGGGVSGISGLGSFGGLGSSYPFLNQPIFPGSMPDGVFGPAQPGLGGLTYGGALSGIGSLAGIGYGAYQLANSNGSTGGLVSGGSSILAGGLGLASLIPGMQWLAPIALGVGLGGGLLGGLLGDSGPKIPPQPALVYNAGTFMAGSSSGDFNSFGGAYDTTGVAKNVNALFQQAGVRPIAGATWGGMLGAGVDHVLQGQQWVDRPYTQTAVLGPQGQVDYTSYNDSSRSPQQAADYLQALTFAVNVRQGGVSGITPALKAGIENIAPQDTASTQNVINMANAYDKLGKAANPVKDSIDKLATSFDSLKDFADQAKLSLDPVNDELAKQTKRTAQDFIDSMLDPLQVQLRALDDERQSALASAQYIKDNVAGVYVDMDKIATYYTNKEAALRDQFYQGSVESLQTLINRLTYGDLANASPDTSLTGTRASYMATLAQAQTGDQTAITNLSTVADSYASSARAYFASSPEYAALVAQIRRDLETVVGNITGGSSSSGGSGAAQLNQASAQIVAANDQLREIVQEQSGQITDLSNQVTALVAALRAQAANRM